MSGVLPTVNLVSQIPVTITVGFGGGSSYGYDSGMGAISPTSVRGSTIQFVRDGNIFVNLGIVGVAAQTLFKEFVVQRTNGTYARLKSSDATFTVVGSDHTEWSWNLGSVTWDATGDRQLIFVY